MLPNKDRSSILSLFDLQTCSFAMAESNYQAGQPIHTAGHVRIICVGAGASGLLFAYKLQRSFSNFSLVIYEKNPEVAGTWWENRYPGYVPSCCVCCPQAGKG